MGARASGAAAATREHRPRVDDGPMSDAFSRVMGGQHMPEMNPACGSAIRPMTAEAQAEFGDAYAQYAQRVSAFIPTRKRPAA